MAQTRKWDDVYRSLNSLTDIDRDEIALKVKIMGEVLAARKAAGMTQIELEKVTHVKQAMIARLENNGVDPQLTTILKILRPLGKTLAVVPLSNQEEDHITAP